MRNARLQWFIAMMVLSAASLMLGCGQGATTTPSGAPSLTLAPSSEAVASGQTVQFSAQLMGVPGGPVTWSVNGVTGGTASTGTITSNGLYTAPSVSTPQSFTVQASSNSAVTLSASGSVTVMVPGCVSATNNPQVAQYSIQAPTGSTVEIDFGPDTGYGLETWSVPAPSAGGAVNMLVAGMRASTTYHMRAQVTLADSTLFLDADRTFATGALPAAQLPAVTATTTPGMTPNGGIEMLDLATEGGSQVTAAAADLQGNIIWSYNNGNPLLVPQPLKLLPDGNMLINYAGQPDGIDSTLEEVDLAGNVVWQMTAADLNQALATAGYNLTVVGTHHDVAILPNGHLIIIASENQNFENLTGYPGTTTVLGDVLIDLDTNRVPVWVWSTFDHLDVNRHLLSFPPDWTHSNAILYSPSDGNLILSMRHQSWIIKIDYENGTGAGGIVWTLGWQGDLTLVGGTDPVDWFYAEHGPGILSTNSSGVFQLSVFDNGNNGYNVGDSEPCGVLTNSACQSRVQVYQIDETAKTATLMWQDDLTLFSFFGGDAYGLANGNMEFDECAASNTPPSGAVYEVTQTTTPQVVWQMQITGQYAYRAFRIPSLYPGVQW
ncbi:MAG TPA: aryl-sulfate sulfotransferase [Terriglobia bacterium]|jgi:hypothetical protein|nr:aryl-sulfate sulfotransferase [Terriglobia bacterium]